jgi:hypothetical protein
MVLAVADGDAVGPGDAPVTWEASTTGVPAVVLPFTVAPSALTSAACDGADPVEVKFAVSWTTDTAAAELSTSTVTGAVSKPYMSVPVIVAVQFPAVAPHPPGRVADSVPDTVFPSPSVILAPTALRTDAGVGEWLVLKYAVGSAVTTDTATILTMAATGAASSPATSSLTVTW